MGNIKITGHKLWWHLDRVEQWYETGDCPPIYIEIGPTNVCNHNCTFCGFDYARGKDFLDTNVLIGALKSMSDYGVKSILYAGAGEPFLHKDFSKIVTKTKEYGIDVAFSTNCSLFNKDAAKSTLPYTSWIRLSLDAATSETHSLIHRPKGDKDDFPTILKNLENAVAIKRKNNHEAVLGVQALLLEENKHEIKELAGLCKKMGVDLLQIKPYSKHPPSISDLHLNYDEFEGLENLEKEIQKFSTRDFRIIFREDRMQRIIKDRGYGNCLALPFWAMVNERGDVIPCDLFYDLPDFSYGNIYEQEFQEIWEGKRRKEVLKKIKERGTRECKPGCRMDLINSDLSQIEKGEIKIEDLKQKGEPPQHVNFI